MMEWRPKGYEFDAKNLVRALFSEQTDEGKLLCMWLCRNLCTFQRLEWCFVADYEYPKARWKTSVYWRGIESTSRVFAHRLAIIRTVQKFPNGFA